MKLEKNHWLSNDYLLFVIAIMYDTIYYFNYY